MNKLRAAIIGLGRIASGYDSGMTGERVYSHAKAYLRNPSVELVAACDPSSEKREEFQRQWSGSIQLFATAEALYETIADLDLVSICSPTPSHAHQLWLALESGARAVVCEKPVVPASELGQLGELLDAYDERRVDLIVNHGMRWEPAVLKIRAELWSNPPLAVQVMYAKGLAHNGSHVIDLCRFLFGEPKDISKQRQFEESPGEVICDFALLYDGFTAAFNGISGRVYSVFDFSIYTPAGRYTITNLTETIQKQASVPHPELPGYRYLTPLAEDFGSQQFRNMSCVLDDVVESLRAGNRHGFLCTGRDAAQTMRVIDRIATMDVSNA